jgi:hypothetical protein
MLKMLSAAKTQECPAEVKSLRILGGAQRSLLISDRTAGASGDSALIPAHSLPENDKPTGEQRPAVGFARLYSLLWIIFHTASPGFPLGFGYSLASAITGCLARVRGAILPLAAAWWRRA